MNLYCCFVRCTEQDLVTLSCLFQTFCLNCFKKSKYSTLCDETCESHVSINAKLYVPFKRSLFTLLSYTVHTKFHSTTQNSSELSHTLFSSLCEIENLATILLICVMSHCISINSPSCEFLNQCTLCTTTKTKVIADF